VSGVGGAAVEIGREAARRAAEEELSRSRYEDEGLLERVWRQLQELVSDLLNSAASGGLGAIVSLVILVALLVGLVALLWWSTLRRMSGSARSATPELFVDGGQTSAQHRASAQGLAEEGRWAEAIRELLRAIARTPEERQLLAELPGRTAGEFAAAAGVVLPSLRTRLGEAARLFDAVTYGQDPGTAEGYAAVAELDEAVRVAEPVTSTR
jgi:hypothetical protein